MATITISKKKPLVLKPTEEAQEVGEVATFAPPDFITAAREPSYLVAGICAILAVLFVVILLLFQWLEMQEYSKPPAAFPQPGATMTPSAPVTPSAPAAASEPPAEPSAPAAP